MEAQQIVATLNTDFGALRTPKRMLGTGFRPTEIHETERTIHFLMESVLDPKKNGR